MPNIKTRDTVMVEAAIKRNKMLSKPKDIVSREPINVFKEAALSAVSVRKATTAYSDFLNSVRESFTTQFIYKLYSEALDVVDPDIRTSINESTLMTMTNTFVKEQGATKLLTRWATKSPLLAEASHCINHYIDLVVEATKDCCKKEICDTTEFKVPKDISTDFYKELDMADFSDVTLQIGHRVLDGIDEFISSNALLKANIEEILTTTKDKIKTAKPSTDTTQQESYSIGARKKITSLNMASTKTIYDHIMTETVKDIMKDDNARTSFIHEGAFDMEKINKYCLASYTLLETVNTTKIINVTEDYIASTLGI